MQKRRSRPNSIKFTPKRNLVKSHLLTTASIGRSLHLLAFRITASLSQFPRAHPKHRWRSVYSADGISFTNKLVHVPTSPAAYVQNLANTGILSVHRSPIRPPHLVNEAISN